MAETSFRSVTIAGFLSCTGRPWLNLLRQLAFVFFACVALLIYPTSTLLLAENLPSTQERYDRFASGFYLAASYKNAVLLVRSREGNLGALFVDFETGRRKLLTSARAHLLSPYLSTDGSRLLLVRQPYDRRGHELLSCETRTFSCKQVLANGSAIVSPIEIANGRILFVSSPYLVGSDGRARYTRNDFWILDDNGPRQLTDFQIYQLNSLSASDQKVYFSAQEYGSENSIFPKRNPLAKEDSDIFSLSLESNQSKVVVPVTPLAPLFPSGGRATQPSVSSDGSVLAFLRTRTDIGNYRYDLVIRDQRGEQLVSSTGSGFSRPIVVGTDVFVCELFSRRRVIKKLSATAGIIQNVAEIEDVDLDRLDQVSIQTNQ